MKITAENLVNFGVCEKIISEPVGGAHTDMSYTAMNISDYLFEAVPRLAALDTDNLLERRYEKFRKIGMFNE